MKKYLLIDDLAEYGWKTILEKAVIKENGSLDIATNFNTTLSKIKNVYDLIFLDLRLSESDHIANGLNEYSGFKILNEIRKGFTEINFCTPIILITASNKVWNIETLQQYGIDGFYIKEHPDYRFDKQTSRQNLESFQSSFLNLKEIGFKRREIWHICNNIVNILDNHPYFKTKDREYLNIKNRIVNKVKLGYNQLFKSQTHFEKTFLSAFNESLSFIIFWSILEELTKGFSDISETWNLDYKRNTIWKFRNSEYFIKKINDSIVINHSYSKATGSYNQEKTCFGEGSSEYNKYFGSSQINLSEQVYSLLSAYSPDKMSFKKLSDSFKELNKYRNDNDFIHSSVVNISTKKLIGQKAIEQAYISNKEVLNFIKAILEIKVK